MTTRNRPNYGVFNLPLTVANFNGLDLPIIGSRVTMIAAVAAGVNVAALVNVAIGKALGDALPFTTGSDVVVGNKFDFVRLTWAAQPGIVATIVISDDVDGNGIHVSAPPTVTAGNLAIVQGGNTAIVTATGRLEVNLAGNDSAVALAGGGTLSTVQNPALNLLPQSGAAAAPQVQPGIMGGSFASSASSANGNTVIVASGSNVNGVVIRRCTLTAPVAGGIGLFMGSVPASLTAQKPIAVQISAAFQFDLAREIFVPPGSGVNCWSGAAGQSYFISYDIL